MTKLKLLAPAVLTLLAPGTALAASKTVSECTAQLLTHRLAIKQARTAPGHVFVRFPRCTLNGHHRDCAMVERWTDDEGLRERVIYIVHVTRTSTGYSAKETILSGPEEETSPFVG